MRRQLLWITLAITIVHSDFARAQSWPSTSIPDPEIIPHRSERIGQEGE